VARVFVTGHLPRIVHRDLKPANLFFDELYGNERDCTEFLNGGYCRSDLN